MSNNKTRVKVLPLNDTDTEYYGYVDGYVMSSHNTVFAIIIKDNGSFTYETLSKLEAVGEIEYKINNI